MKLLSGVTIACFMCARAAAVDAAPRTLSFEDRVRAQEAIERVYYKHQIGATMPFERAVPRAVLEQKVRKYLEQTVTLQTQWKTRVSEDALQRELLRMTAGTRLPERLQELHGALGNDPFLIKECLARAILVDRLTRNFEGFDRSPSSTPGAATDRAVAADPPVCAFDGWDNRSLDDGPEPMGDPSSVWTGSEMLVWGDEATGRGWRYDPAIDHWAPMSIDGAPSARRYAASVIWTGSSMIVWGGLTDTPQFNVYLDSGARYDPLTDSWSPTSTVGAPSARLGHTAVWTGSRMIVWGGGADFQTTDSGGLYDPVTDTWSPTATAGAPSPSQGHTAVWAGSVMVVHCGDGTGGRYDPASNTWTPTSTVGAPSGFGDTAVWTGSSMVVWSGFEGGRYDLASDTWLPVTTSNAPTGRRNHSAVWTGSSMIVWGGSSPSGTYFDAGALYDPVTDQWTPTSTNEAPSPRGYHTAVWTGQLMVVWGGLIQSSTTGWTTFLSTGGRYDPATDSWTPTATGSAGTPAPRSGHSAVWTGNQMLIWGGDGEQPPGASPLGSGGRYDPATDSWTPITMSNAPGPRMDHTAVWTGDAMIVWGGGFFVSGVEQPSNTGGSYNPITDAWTATATSGAPTARMGHTAVWTGSTMVVWGGFNQFESPWIGGRYDPSTNSWAPASTSGAPSARQQHSAVWTGSEMIVWGGWSELGDSGGLYDPVGDTWIPMSTPGEPTMRAGHVAIWTGSKMLIWGGQGFDSPPFDGASYDPVLDSWAPMTRIGQPPALTDGSAVWTGSEMLVWGGSRLSPGNAGARYDPATNTWRATTTVGAPSPRYGHTAVWTGSRMVVWGGTNHLGPLATGGSYFLNGTPTDECDGDGVTVADGDCNDHDPTVYPGASENCNGVDDDCDGFIDDGGGLLCGDGNPCTDDTCEPQGGCTHSPVAEWTSCDDENVCNGNEYCDGFGFCQSFNPPQCGIYLPCILEYCDPVAGCVYEPRPAGYPCSDGESCNGPEACDESGQCGPGTPVQPPPEVLNLTAGADKSTYAWSAAPNATQYQAVRGRTDNLPVGPGAGEEICFNDLPAATLTDADIPPDGTAYWYIARGRNSCTIGTYGRRSNGTERVTATCP